MANGMWPSVSGATAKSFVVDTVSNNLANAEAWGYKKDSPAFREYLATLERDNTVHEVPRGPIKDKDLYPLDGRDQSFVIVDGTYTDFKSGNLRVTNNPLDVALNGKGFLEVGTPNGIRLTRQGSLKMAMDGRLVTSEGYPVLSFQGVGLATAQPATAVQPDQGRFPTQGGVAAGLSDEEKAEIVARTINLGDRPGRISVTEEGDVFVGEQNIAKLSVVEFKDLNQLRKSGGQLFVNRDPLNRIPAADATTTVKQGMLEMSNVNPVEEMTALIKAHRGFEQDMKAIRTYDQMMSKEVNELGKL